MRVTRRSPLTGKMNTIDLDVTQEQLDRYGRGVELAQNVFPQLMPAEREFIMTGYTAEDWASMFPPDEEDE